MTPTQTLQERKINENQIIKRINGEQVRVSVGKCLSTAHIYLYYLSIIKSKTFNVKYSIFKKILEDYNTSIVDEILDGAEYKLPFGMGKLRIKKSKMMYTDHHKLRLDYKQTKDLNKKVYHLNLHSSEWKARFFWSKKDIKSRQKNYYCFQPIKPIKLKLSAQMKLKDKWKTYLE